jgi:hypothetical protein
MRPLSPRRPPSFSRIRVRSRWNERTNVKNAHGSRSGSAEPPVAGDRRESPAAVDDLVFRCFAIRTFVPVAPPSGPSRRDRPIRSDRETRKKRVPSTVAAAAPRNRPPATTPPLFAYLRPFHGTNAFPRNRPPAPGASASCVSRAPRRRRWRPRPRLRLPSPCPARAVAALRAARDAPRCTSRARPGRRCRRAS